MNGRAPRSTAHPHDNGHLVRAQLLNVEQVCIATGPEAQARTRRQTQIKSNRNNSSARRGAAPHTVCYFAHEIRTRFHGAQHAEHVLIRQGAAQALFDPGADAVQRVSAAAGAPAWREVGGSGGKEVSWGCRSACSAASDSAPQLMAYVRNCPLVARECSFRGILRGGVACTAPCVSRAAAATNGAPPRCTRTCSFASVAAATRSSAWRI